MRLMQGITVGLLAVLLGAIAAPDAAQATDDNKGKFKKERESHHRYRVVNVTPGETLTIHSMPGSAEVVATLPGNATHIRLKKCRMVPGFRDGWCLVAYKSVEGWASGSYFARQ
jgi:hypothetical protein